MYFANLKCDIDKKICNFIYTKKIINIYISIIYILLNRNKISKSILYKQIYFEFSKMLKELSNLR